jgi:hypothetical protein
MFSGGAGSRGAPVRTAEKREVADRRRDHLMKPAAPAKADAAGPAAEVAAGPAATQLVRGSLIPDPGADRDALAALKSLPQPKARI